MKKETKRNGYVVAYRKKHPKESYREIAEVFQITRQRAHRIVKDYGGNNVSVPEMQG